MRPSLALCRCIGRRAKAYSAPSPPTPCANQAGRRKSYPPPRPSSLTEGGGSSPPPPARGRGIKGEGDWHASKPRAVPVHRPTCQGLFGTEPADPLCEPSRSKEVIPSTPTLLPHRGRVGEGEGGTPAVPGPRSMRRSRHLPLRPVPTPNCRESRPTATAAAASGQRYASKGAPSSRGEEGATQGTLELRPQTASGPGGLAATELRQRPGRAARRNHRPLGGAGLSRDHR